MSILRENKSRLIQSFPYLFFDRRQRSCLAGMVLEAIVSFPEVGKFESDETGTVFGGIEGSFCARLFPGFVGSCDGVEVVCLETGRAS